MANEPVKNNWNEWRNYILKAIDKSTDNQKEIYKQLDHIRVEIAQLKVKAGIWGLIGGVVPVAVMLGVWILRGIK